MKIIIALKGDPCDTCAQVQAVIEFDGVKPAPVETMSETLSYLDLSKLRAFVEKWQALAKENNIPFLVKREIASELMYAAYWAGVPAQAQIRDDSPVEVVIRFDENRETRWLQVEPDDPKYSYITLSMFPLADKEQLAQWMSWGFNIVDIPGGLTFAYAPSLALNVPGEISASKLAKRASVLEEHERHPHSLYIVRRLLPRPRSVGKQRLPG